VAEEIFALANGKSAGPSQLINRLSEPELTRLIAESTSIVDDIKDKQKNLEDCIRWIKYKHAESRLSELQNLIKAAQMMETRARSASLWPNIAGWLNAGKSL
jgi:hypothetical protein